MTLALTNQAFNFVAPDCGVVMSLKDGIIRTNGLYQIFSGEIVYDDFHNYGMALNLEYNSVGIVLFSEKKAKAGSLIRRTYNLAKITVSAFLLGLVFNTFGNSLNTRLNFSYRSSICTALSLYLYLGLPKKNIEQAAPGIISRQSVYETVFTGIKVIDGLIPLGQGQRELIIGDRQTGKSAIALDSILNQSRYDVLFNNL